MDHSLSGSFGKRVCASRAVWSDDDSSDSDSELLILISTCVAEAELKRRGRLFAHNGDDNIFRKPRSVIHRPNSKESIYYKQYIEDPKYKDAPEGSLFDLQFRHRFRMSWSDMDNLYKMAMEKNWFPGYDIKHLDKRLNRKYPLKLLLMCCMAILGDVITFEGISDVAFIPEETIREFFDLFVTVGNEQMCDEFIKTPDTLADLHECTDAYTAAGFPGVIGSIDGVHVQIRRCPHGYQRQYIGKEKTTTVCFLVAVRYDLQVIYCSRAYPGSSPDVSIARDDPFLERCRNHKSYREFEWKYIAKDEQSLEIKSRTGAMLLADNGFQGSDIFVRTFPASSPAEARFDRMQESLRKDSERTFGVTKVQFPTLMKGLQFGRLHLCERAVRTSFALGNYVRGRRPRKLRESPLGSNDGLILRMREVQPGRVQSNGSSAASTQTTAAGNVPSWILTRQIMVEHFDCLYQKKLLRWPRMERVSRRTTYQDELSDEEDATRNEAYDDGSNFYSGI